MYRGKKNIFLSDRPFIYRKEIYYVCIIHAGSTTLCTLHKAKPLLRTRERRLCISLTATAVAVSELSCVGSI